MYRIRTTFKKGPGRVRFIILLYSSQMNLSGYMPMISKLSANSVRNAALCCLILAKNAIACSLNSEKVS